MIGQEQLLTKMIDQIHADKFPRFAIITGAKGSGKKTLADCVSVYLSDMTVTLGDVKVNTIREMITNANKVQRKTLYIIPDADSMSIEAKNAILKVTEEPPNNAYFIMTLEDINNTLDTIKSRGTVYQMQRYTPKQLESYYLDIVQKDSTEIEKECEVVRDICENPGEVQLLNSMDVTEFYAYVNKVVDNIADVSTANSFKIADKISFKPDADGYNLKLFWKAFSTICLQRVKLNSVDVSEIKYNVLGVSITSKYLADLRVNSLRKDSLFDAWVMEIRNNWKDR